MELKHIHRELNIKATPEKLWEVLSQYGDVSSFHSGVVESYAVTGSSNDAVQGCERVCNIVDMGMKIMLKERIIDYVEGKSYRYEVYEWKNFPLRKMYFGFTITSSDPTHTTLAIDIDFKAKPAFLTPMMASKMRNLADDVLIGYKHYTETGQKRVPIKQLKKQYKSMGKQEVQYAQ